jgi:hypothetical protein
MVTIRLLLSLLALILMLYVLKRRPGPKIYPTSAGRRVAWQSLFALWALAAVGLAVWLFVSS